MPVYTTSCPRNCYSTCSMQVTVEDGRVRRIEAQPLNQATPEGPCLKGLSYVEREDFPGRLLHPLKKVDGGYVRIGWDEALDLIVAQLQRVKETWGPQALFYYAASATKGLLNAVGMDFWRLYGGCTTTYGDLCWPAGLEATRLTLGENKHNAPWDLANAKLIVMWGKNTAETNIHQMLFVDQALERGATLIVIDPRRTQTAERASLLIQPRPGTDGALALGVAHLLIRNGHVDLDFVERHALGYEPFKEMVAEYPPDRVAEITEIPVNMVERLAESLGTIRPATINTGFGMQRYTNSGQAMRAILALCALTGNIGKPGAGWIYANLQTQIFSAVKDPIDFYPPEKPDGVVRVSISTARLGQDLLAAKDPPIKMIWVERGNPIPQNPETNTVLRAFRNAEYRVVVEEFMTDTAREADLILPAKTLFEQTDVIGAYWHPYIQIKRKILDPPGEVKPESEIYWHLAQRFGFPEETLAGRIPAPGDQAVEAYLERKLRPFPELTLEKLKQGPVLAPGSEAVAFADMVFPTPSGKIELVSEEAQRRWNVDPLPRYSEPEESARNARKFPLYLMTPNTKNRIHSQFNNLTWIEKLSPGPTVTMHPQDARARGIRQGDTVRIFNDRGELRLEAQLDFSLKPGCVAVTNGWWITQGGAVNVCSYGRETDMGYGAAFHDNLVQAEKV